jgi:uncharacterized protein GlcG (DUF336 family)
MKWLTTVDTRARSKRPGFQPTVEQLEDRMVPAFIASQLNVPALQPLTLTNMQFGSRAPQVQTLLQRAAGATSSDNAIIAVVDRNGSILGVRVEGNVSAAVTGNPNVLDFSIDGAVSLARTAAFFSTNATPLTSRTVQFISQSTITQREVNSYTFISDPNSTIGGPGFVAPIGIGGHFPPNVANTPQVDLFGIEHTNRDMLVNPGPNSNGVLFTPGGGGSPANDVALTGRFNINPAFIPAGKTQVAPLSYYDTLLPPGITGQQNPAIPHVAARGIGTLPGGIPIYEGGILVGGIGVFFPGTTGFASEENSSLSADFNPNKPDLSLEAEFIALAAVGGSKTAGFPVGAIAGIPALPGFDLPFPRIDLVGITLDAVGPGGTQGPNNLINYAKSHFSIGAGNPFSGFNAPVNSVAALTIPGRPAPEGWLVTPHAGANLTAAQVQQIIVQGINQANVTRAQIRPLGTTTRMVLSVADSAGNVLGLYRMPDAPMFSINVAVAKARDAAYYDDPAQLLAVDCLAGLPAGTSLTARTFRYLALPRFPEGINPAPPGPWSILMDPGVNRLNGLNTGVPQPISAFTSVLGFDSFHPNTTFHKFGANSSGVVFFPGSSAVYVNGKIVGGFGVSGDGVDEDDVVTSGGIAGFGPPTNIQVDQFFFNGVRLPYQKFNRNPKG